VIVDMKRHLAALPLAAAAPSPVKLAIDAAQVKGPMTGRVAGHAGLLKRPRMPTNITGTLTL
jgi:hypothetical protein